MSKAKVYYCLHCERAFQVEGYLDSCPLCGRRQDLIEGQIPDREPVKSASLPASSQELEFELTR